MTQEKVPATAEQGQAPAKNVEAAQAARSPEAQEVTAQAPKLAAGNKEMPAAKTAPEAEAQAAAEAPAPAAEQFAYAAPMPQQAESAHAKYLDEKGDKDDKDAKSNDDASQDEAPVDLAMLSEVEFLDGGEGGGLPVQMSEDVAGLAFQDDASADDGGSGAGIILPILAVAAAGGGIALLAGGGNDPTDPPAPPPPPPPPPPPANAAPVITSGDAADIDENSPVSTVVYKAVATDANSDTITYSLTGDDAAAFNIDAATGDVTFKASPDFETDASYSINVVASDGKGGSDTQAVTITVNDVEPETGVGTPVNLDTSDNDANPLTPLIFDAGTDDFAFSDDDGVASTTTIQHFEEGDTIDFGDADVSFSTGSDAKDLEMTVTVNGVVSTVILDDVLDGGFQLIETAEQAEEAVGFDFFVGNDAVDTAAANDASFG